MMHIMVGRVLLVVLVVVMLCVPAIQVRAEIHAPLHAPQIAGVSEMSIEEGRTRSPVLIVSAGVLPESRWWLLDRTDEWLDRTVFSFGVRRLRVESDLRHAAERVAELQVMEANGTRTPEGTQKHMEAMSQDLGRAATSVGSSVAHGDAPLLLVQRTVRTLIASVEALDELLATDIAMGDEGVHMIARVENLERAVFERLLPNDTALSKDLLALVLHEYESDVMRRFVQLQAEAPLAASDVISVARDVLFSDAQTFVEEARAHTAQEDLASALTLLQEARSRLRWLKSGVLAVPPPEMIGEEETMSRVDTILAQLFERGLISDEQSAQVRKGIEGRFGIVIK